MTRLITLNAAALIAATTLSLGAAAPVHAAGCYYKVFDTYGRYLQIRGVGHAAKKSWACNRARRKCNRRLDRAIRKGTLKGRHGGTRGIQCKKVGS